MCLCVWDSVLCERECMWVCVCVFVWCIIALCHLLDVHACLSGCMCVCICACMYVCMHDPVCACVK